MPVLGRELVAGGVDPGGVDVGPRLTNRVNAHRLQRRHAEAFLTVALVVVVEFILRILDRVFLALETFLFSLFQLVFFVVAQRTSRGCGCSGLLDCHRGLDNDS